MHLDPEATANRDPSRDHLISKAARSILKMTKAGFHSEVVTL